MRRQLGCERRAGAAPMVHATPSRSAMSAARFALFFTLAAWAAYFVEQLRRYASSPITLRGTIETGAYLLVVTLLTTSAAAYLLARLGHLHRVRDHRRASRAVVDAVFDGRNPTMTAILPSYREEARVIRQSLLSVALQEYPSLRVVLLVDDPPDPDDEASRRTLERARALPGEIAALLAEPRARFEAALDAFERAAPADGGVGGQELVRVAAAYDRAAQWFREAIAAEEVTDHTDAFLVNEILLRQAEDLTGVARALREAVAARAELSVSRVRHLYRRLVWIFRADLSAFERKRYASLSHESNKAMNLNAFIGLMGGRYRERDTVAGRILLPVRGGDFDLEVPDPDYVLTLDADSMLLPEYCLRLVAFLERPENADVAVAQTPYSAYRGAPTRIERLAGATTDIQHIVHQGLTRYGATFWVGANAVLRKTALDTIAIEEPHNGFTIRRYIQDRTVVEDTESSVDIRIKGWRLVNYPERLSYSATPPDLGALCVQRQRWANGGLVILPHLARLVRVRGRGHRRAMAVEAFLRCNYLASIAWASVGLWLLLFYPFEQAFLSSLAVLTALPYFVAMSTDLRRSGYRRGDVFRIYGLNLLLLAVNTAGVLKSVGQAIGGQKVPFARTPKVKNRTVTPMAFVLIPILIVLWSVATLANGVADRSYLHAAFAGMNAVLMLYALLAFHGPLNVLRDILRDIGGRFAGRRRAREAPAAAADWVTVLYHGGAASGERADGAAVAQALAAMDQERSRRAPEILLNADGTALAARPAEASGAPATSQLARDADVLARALAERLLALEPGGTLTLRLAGDGLHLGLDGRAAPAGGPRDVRADGEVAR